MSDTHVFTSQRGDGAHQCEECTAAIAEIETIRLRDREQFDKEFAAIRQHVRCLEATVGKLAGAIASNELRISHYESFVKSFGDMSRVLSGEADRLTS